MSEVDNLVPYEHFIAVRNKRASPESDDSAWSLEEIGRMLGELDEDFPLDQDIILQSLIKDNPED